MPDLPSEERAYEAALPLAGASAPPGARVLRPIAVRTPEGDVESWFVPVALGESLVGYVRGGRGRPSYSAFGRSQPLAAWTDAEQVRRLAEQAGLRPGGDPYLGYDGVPARLAWVVPLAEGGRAHVAGEAVWRSSHGSDNT